MRRIASIACVLLVACAPRLDDRLFLVDAPRVIAVRSEPAEAAPGASVTVRALVVAPTGEIEAPLDWAFCVERAPLASLGSVSAHCLETDGPAIVPFGARGVVVTGRLPADGCRVFGPEVPAPGRPTDPPGRPVDPDPSGGYYQPLHVIASSESSRVVIERTRIACGLASGTGDDRVAYMHRYHANENPALATIELVRTDGSRTPIDPRAPTPVHVHAHDHVVLRVGWTDCGTSVDALPRTGCAGAEPFLGYDAIAAALVERREAMRLAWFATGGELDVDRTGVTAADTTTSSSNAWLAPTRAGPASIWVVLRDDRGGVGWSRIDVVVD